MGLAQWVVPWGKGEGRDCGNERARASVVPLSRALTEKARCRRVRARNER
jgi:hypothetical protein